MRSLSEQTSAELGGPVSVLTRQKSDHVKLSGLLAELDATPPADQDPVLRRIYRLVFPHAFAEESVLWPAIRRVLPEGEQLTLKIEQEHQEVNELVTALEQRSVDDPERSRILSRLVQVLREDVRDEEDELLPRLQAALTVGQLRSLGVAWEVVRRTAPTRAHPVVARRPPGNVAAAVPLSVLDRLRDLVDSAYQQGPTEGGSALRTASTGLTALAHRVEQLPIMKKGEDPTTHRG
jgi:hemerythrin superfamily protein